MRPRTANPLRGPASTLSDVIKLGFFHQVQLLVSTGVSLESPDALGRTPIIHCAFLEPETWGVSISMTLIEHEARVARRDRSGRNALHYACIYEREGLVRVLLRAIDFNLNQTDIAGNTALHYAAMSGNVTVTNFLVQALRRYKVSLEKVNQQSRTPLEEAFYIGNEACCRVIEQEMAVKIPESAMKDVRFAEDVSGPPPYCPRPLGGWHPSGKTVDSLRPSSAVAFLTGQYSSSSINSTDDKKCSISFRSRSNQILPIGGYDRKCQNLLSANDYKRDDEIIVCASENDFRNKPKYVFKMLHLPYDPEDVQPIILMDSTNRNNKTWADANSGCQTQVTGPLPNWRKELKLMFKVYENQCSRSWRATIKCVEPPVAPDPRCLGSEEVEEKGRRGRRSSIVSRSGKEGVPDMRRRPSTTRIKRLPSGSGGKLDWTLDTSTSSESINSLVSSKKRVMDRETGLAGSIPSPPPLSSPSGSRPGSSSGRRPSLKSTHDLHKVFSRLTSRRGSNHFMATSNKMMYTGSSSATDHTSPTSRTISDNHNSCDDGHMSIHVVKESLVPRATNDQQADTDRLSVPSLYEKDDENNDVNESENGQ